jgi:hypothetical protein
MSRARKVKKLADGSPLGLRLERLSDKRYSTDPSYLRGQLQANAPVKYSRCTVCVGRPHHPPAFVFWRTR